MKVIMLMFDSLNRQMLEPYGCDWTKTPNFTRLAKHTVTFDNCYAGSLPCMPARREIHTGRYNFLHRSWGPIEPFDDSMPTILSQNGVYTHLISDHSHYWEDGGATYHQRYNSWESVRGQEGDRWKASVIPPVEPEHLGRYWAQDEVNRLHLSTEKDMPLHQIYNLGMEFLEENAGADNWFLQLEAFDPHEPFYSQDEFKKLYPHDYDGPRFDWPEYRAVNETKKQVEHCRYEYAALLSACDYYLGTILDYMDAHDMWKDTMLIVNTDHGFLLGEHECWAKCWTPFYDEIAHTPLFIWDPRIGCEGEHRKALVQTIDIAPTIMEFFDCEIPVSMQGKSLKETLQCDAKIRDAALFGIFGGPVNITDGHYVYMRDAKEDNSPLFEYTLMPTHMRSLFFTEEMTDMTLSDPLPFTKGVPVLKIANRPDTHVNEDLQQTRFGTRLYDLEKDPYQRSPIKNPEVEEHLKKLMITIMKNNDAPKEQFERLEL